MTISVKPMEGVVITCPVSLSDQEVYKILQEKSHWIHRQSVRVANWKNHFTRFEEGKEYRTRAHRLIMETHNRPPIV
jgi:predicted metal-dependent hydrolase